jgi:hypothetical protein
LFLKVERAVDAAKREDVEIERLRLGDEVWEGIREDHLGMKTLFGYEVEVEEDPNLIDVV